MNISDIFTGLRVKVMDLEQPAGLLAEVRYLGARKPGAVGTVTGAVKDHENAWWVRHDAECGGAVAPYWYSELAPGPPAPERPDPFKGRPIFD